MNAVLHFLYESGCVDEFCESLQNDATQVEYKKQFQFLVLCSARRAARAAGDESGLGARAARHLLARLSRRRLAGMLRRAVSRLLVLAHVAVVTGTPTHITAAVPQPYTPTPALAC